MQDLQSRPYVGILLAGGRGTRFDPSGTLDKLQQLLPNARTVAVTAATNLLAAVTHVVAVVRPDAGDLARELAQLGCEVVVCDDAANGMARSLVCGLMHAPDAAGWVIALADMPFVQRATISALVAALAAGADIASPVYQGVRGNPVAFAAARRPDLLQLTGDEGARSMLKKSCVTEITVADPGIRQDIDIPADLPADLRQACA